MGKKSFLRKSEIFSIRYSAFIKILKTMIFCGTQLILVEIHLRNTVMIAKIIVIVFKFLK